MIDARWIPELEAEALPLQRVFLAEKWLVARLHYGHVDPREAGVGNIVNCGAAMYMAPVGIVNAGDPAGAYAEAIDVAGAHQSSYGREAAGVFAAAVAAAMRARARRPTSVVDGGLALAKDGTRAAIEAVCEAAAPAPDWESALAAAARGGRARTTRSAGLPRPVARTPGGRAGCTRSRSCRSRSGMLVVAGGDYRGTVLGAVNYGRDCRLDRDDGRAPSPARWAAGRGPRRVGEDRRRGQPRSTCAGRRPDHGRRSPREVFAARRRPPPRATRRSAPARRPVRRLTDAADLGPAGGPAAATSCGSPPRTAGTSTRSRDRWVAAGGTPSRPAPERLPSSPRPSCEPWPTSCWTSWTRCPSPAGRRAERLGRDRRGPARRPARARRAYRLDPDRVRGAWLGRAVGCVLGKPVEKIPRAGIGEILRPPATGR